MQRPTWVDNEIPNEVTLEDPSTSEVQERSQSDEGEVSDNVEDRYVPHQMSSSPVTSEDSSDEE